MTKRALSRATSVARPASFHGVEHGIEILVGGRSFILRILAAVRQDVVGDEFVIHGLLVEGAVGGFAAHATACAVVNGISGFSPRRDRRP